MYTKIERYISKAIKTLFFVLVISLTLSSCLSSDSDNAATESTCYISAVTFTTMKRNVDGTISTISTSTWPFTINQREHHIENRDSLPYGVVTKALLANITYYGASLQYRSQNAWEGDEWTTYSTSDSIDFSMPLFFRVYATDQTYQTYTMKFNVHQIPSDSTTWIEMAGLSDLANAEDIGMISTGDSLVLVVKKNNVITITKRAEHPNGGRKDYQTKLPEAVIPMSIRKNDDGLYLEARDEAVEKDEATGKIDTIRHNTLYCSTDEGRTWKEIYKSSDFILAAVSDDKIYGLKGIKFVSTTKLGQELTDNDWNPEKDDGQKISDYPATEVESSYYVQTNGLTRILLTGKNNNDKPVVWAKVWNSNEDTGNWVYYPCSTDNIYYMPDMVDTNIMRYGDSSIAVGRTDTMTLSNIYSSYDQGISWTTSNTLKWPTAIRETTGTFATTVCEDNFIWIVAGGRLFRGRKNALGWAD